jgi:peptidyl-prolyl cis-trans isomerase D
MLNGLRKAAGTWVAKLLLLLLVLSFAVWGISGSVMGGLGGNNVVTVGGTEVSTTEYRLAYDRQLSILSQQFGARITREQATAFGIDDQVLAQLVSGAVLDEQARKLGLGLSKDRLANLTAEDPAFQGADGRFDRNQFNFVLNQVGMRPEDYLNNRAQLAVRQQIIAAVADGMDVPDVFLRAVALYRGEDRTVEYVVLPKSLVEPVADPSNDVLQAWFEERKADYAAPEYRKISYVKLEPEDIADPSAITDDQVRQDYEANKNRYTTPQTRTIEQLVFPDEAAAQAALDSIRGGSSFEEVVAAQGKTLADVRLGTFPKARVPDPAVGEAAFALDANQVSGIVQGAFGPVILRVTAITPEVVRPFEEVSEEIRRDLAVAEANRILLDVHDAYEDARAGGDTLREAAAKQGLDVVTVEAIDRTGQTPQGQLVDTLPQSAELLREAFESEANVENPPVNIGSDGFVFYEVEGVTPGRERPLEEVRERVLGDWKAGETARLLAARAAELEKRLSDGGAMDEIAAELSLEKQIKRGIKREADDPDFGEAGAAAIFGVKEGGSGVFAAPTGDAQILFKVTESFEPAAAGPDSLPEDVRNSFASGMADDLLDQLVTRLQTEYEVEVNRGAVQRALSF